MYVEARRNPPLSLKFNKGNVIYLDRAPLGDLDRVISGVRFVEKDDPGFARYEEIFKKEILPLYRGEDEQ